MEKNKALVSEARKRNLKRLAMSGIALVLLIIISLAIGMAGYHFTENMPWVDSFLNASMIIGGMGPVGELHTEAGKLFAGFFAIYSGLFLIAATGLMLVPVFHNVLHRFHYENKDVLKGK